MCLSLCSELNLTINPNPPQNNIIPYNYLLIQYNLKHKRNNKNLKNDIINDFELIIKNKKILFYNKKLLFYKMKNCEHYYSKKYLMRKLKYGDMWCFHCSRYIFSKNQEEKIITNS